MQIRAWKVTGRQRCFVAVEFFSRIINSFSLIVIWHVLQSNKIVFSDDTLSDFYVTNT